MTEKILEEIKSKSPSELLGIEMDLLKKYQEAELAERRRAAVERKWRIAEAEKREALQREKQAQKEREQVQKEWEQAQKREKQAQKREKQAQKREKQAQKREKQAQKTIIDTILTLSNQYKYDIVTIAAIVKRSPSFVERILTKMKR